MGRIDDNTFEIRTYDNGVLHFVIGSEYKAMGTVGMGKDIEIVGKLKYNSLVKDLLLVSEDGLEYSINPRTLSFL